MTQGLGLHFPGDTPGVRRCSRVTSLSSSSLVRCASIALIIGPSVAYAHDPTGIVAALIFGAWILTAVVALAVVPLKRVALRSQPPADPPAWGPLFGIALAETILFGIVIRLVMYDFSKLVLVLGGAGYLVAVAVLHRAILEDQVKSLRTAFAMSLPVPVVSVILSAIFVFAS